MFTADIHGGNFAAVSNSLKIDSGCLSEPLYDFSVNLNPLGPPSVVEEILHSGFEMAEQYPAIFPAKAERALAEAHKADSERLILCNGSTEAFSLILQALKPQRVVWSAPAYSGYSEICAKLSIKAEPVPAKLQGNSFQPDYEKLAEVDADVVFICSPNNPSGQRTNSSDIIKFARGNSGKTVVLDESFIDFLPDADGASLIGADLPRNLIVVKSLTKFFSIAGLRLGFAYVADMDSASAIRNMRLPWSVNGLAQAVACELYSDKAYISRTIEYVRDCREFLAEGIDQISALSTFPSETNFILCRINGAKTTSAELQSELLKKGFLIRSCSQIPALNESYIRLAVRHKKESALLIQELRAFFNESAAESAPPEKSKALMLVGTASNSGKSIMTSAFCRYFAKKGIKVAPFKAQNMSLNSFVTKEGGEMGRAQVVQAEACRELPHTDMNPVLLKPLGDSTSQIIINGKAVASMTAKNYYLNKQIIRKEAFAAFDRLKSRFDLLILEGAGSPAEINLLEEDFVNMRMAAHANAATILVADIDRGGVFASIFGTVKLIPREFRERLKGIIINKFRGDKSLLGNGIEKIEKLTGIPVLGVMPFVENLNIEDEDSVALEGRESLEKGIVDIAVIRLPRISNHTDFLALETCPGISVRYVARVADIGRPDLIIIPGSKNTIADMIFLRESGLEARIRTARKHNIPIIGICGGYQMLGEKLFDPKAVEGDIDELDALGFLPVSTQLEDEKELAQVEGETCASLPFAEKGTLFKGYEIHAGKTVALDSSERAAPLTIAKRRDEERRGQAGFVSDDGLVFGCYIHGLFDSEPLRRQLIEWLCRRKGVEPDAIVHDSPESQDEIFDRLVAALEANVDMGKVESFIA